MCHRWACILFRGERVSRYWFFPRQLVESELVFAGLPDAIPRMMAQVERPHALAHMMGRPCLNVGIPPPDSRSPRRSTRLRDAGGVLGLLPLKRDPPLLFALVRGSLKCSPRPKPYYACWPVARGGGAQGITWGVLGGPGPGSFGVPPWIYWRFGTSLPRPSARRKERSSKPVIS